MKLIEAIRGQPRKHGAVDLVDDIVGQQEPEEPNRQEPEVDHRTPPRIPRRSSLVIIPIS
ncbi:MAG: hypothetical protein MK110_05270 [Fuerstiella sp.]|nr:hypothetical protein [Fuerstiella sp.]